MKEEDEVAARVTGLAAENEEEEQRQHAESTGDSIHRRAEPAIAHILIKLQSSKRQ